MNLSKNEVILLNVTTFVIGLLAFMVQLPVMAKDVITIGVVGKTKHDSFYEQSWQGCKDYARSLASEELEIICRYDGPEFFQDIREQAIVVNKVIDSGVDGLLISTTDSNYLVKNALTRAEAKSIPVITFDSDLLPEHRQHRLAYVGTNNFDFGVALGEAAKQYKREGITKVCIQSGHESTPNLDQRIKGVRFALSDGKNTSRLEDEMGWNEYERCPFYTLGKRTMAVNQLELVLKRSVPMFIAVAGFAQFSPDYVTKVGPYLKQILQQSTVIISADTEPLQLTILAQGLSTLNIGQRPHEMGFLGAKMLHQFIQTKVKPQQEFTYLGFHTCTADNVQTCTLN
jgi:ribose transport system substrate-binding protein